MEFRRLPHLKGHSSTPSLQFLINVGHRQKAVFLFPTAAVEQHSFSKVSPHTAASGSICFCSLLAHGRFWQLSLLYSLPAHGRFWHRPPFFAVFSCTPLQTSRTRSLVAAFDFLTVFLRTPSQASRKPSLVAAFAFSQSCTKSLLAALAFFAAFLHKVAFGSVCSAVLPYSHSWQLSLCAALPHMITLRQHSLFVTIPHTAAQTALALHSPLTHGRSRQRLLFAILTHTVSLAALTFCSLPEHGCFSSTRSSPTLLQSSCIQSLVAAFAFAAFLQTASWQYSPSSPRTQLPLAAFAVHSLTHSSSGQRSFFAVFLCMGASAASTLLPFCSRPAHGCLWQLSLL